MQSGAAAVTSPHSRGDPRAEVQLVPVHLPAKDMLSPPPLQPQTHKQRLPAQSLNVFVFLPEQLHTAKYPPEGQTSSRAVGRNHLSRYVGGERTQFKCKNNVSFIMMRVKHTVWFTAKNVNENI